MPSTRIVEAIEDERVRATTTVEVIQKFAHVFARRRDRPAAARIAYAWAVLLSPLIATTREDLERGLAIFEGASRLGA